MTNRKTQHIKIALNENVKFKEKTAGFENYDFIHCALPEMAIEDADTSVCFLNYELSFPFLISAITGGCAEAFDINKKLAAICQSEGIALALGSQRPMLFDRSMLNTYKIARGQAPDIPIMGNIGCTQLVKTGPHEIIERLIQPVCADALTVHLNPLQELLQPEGDKDFTGVIEALKQLVLVSPVPVIVKETGCGISENTAIFLKNAGIEYIDIAGAGGTSFARVESFRGADPKISEAFADWGNPTADAIFDLKKITGIKIIASGGISDGLTLAKALALGAHMAGSALQVLSILKNEGEDSLKQTIKTWRNILKSALFLTGCRNIEAFRTNKNIRKR